MGEVSEMFDVNPSLLRYWEQEFDTLRPRRNNKGNRLFAPQDIETVRAIYHLVKERNMKIETARRYLKSNREKALFEAELTERLMNIKSLLMEIKSDLQNDGDSVENVAYSEEQVDTEDVTMGIGTQNFVEVAEEADRDADTENTILVDNQENVDEQPTEDMSADATVETVQVQRPAFEEQMLFEIAVPAELLQKGTEVIDNGYESAKAGFEGQSLDADSDTEPAPTPERNAIEQTLF